MSLERLTERFVDAWFRFHPHHASEKGYRRYDGRVPCESEDEIGRFRAEALSVQDALEALDLARAPADVRLDATLLKGHCHAALLALDVLHAPDLDPLFYLRPLLEGMESLEVRMEAGEGDLWPALTARLEGAAPLLREAERRVREPIAPFREAALDMLEGALAHLSTRFTEPQAPPAAVAAAADAARALQRYRDHLERQDPAPFRPMGEEAYRDVLRVEHLLPDDPQRWVDLARTTLASTELLLAEARQAEPRPPEPPEEFGRPDVLAYYAEEIAAVRRFVEERDLVTIPEGELRLRETPPHLAALVPGAFYLPPPPFAGGRTGWFFVRPVPETMSRSTTRHFFDVVHDRRFRNLVAHEVWPGHHVQFLHVAHRHRPVRDLRDNDVMIEGWALYCEGLMQEQGLWEDRPSPRPLEALRFRALRVLADVGIHTGSLTLEQAADLFENDGHEVRRYAHEPTQALSYLVGAHLVRELREELQPLRLRDFHDRFLAEGSIPIPLIRERLRA